MTSPESPTLTASDVEKERELSPPRSELAADAHASAEEGRQQHTSAGVERIKLLATSMTPVLKGFLFFSAFLIAYGYGLDSNVRSTYQAKATASYATHSLLSTVNVFRSVAAAVAQPPLARISDSFGRLSLVYLACLFYCLGTIVEACSDRVEKFAAGAILYQIGLTSAIVLVEVIVADVSNLRNRLFVTYLIPLPFIINTWVSGDVASSVLGRTTWKWGIGMWAVIFPVCCLPMVVVLLLARRRAKKLTNFNDIVPTYKEGVVQAHGFLPKTKAFFRGLRHSVPKLLNELDVVGLFLLLASLILFLVPMTLAGGASKSWGTAKIIVMLVLGILLFPVFIYWETRYAEYPIAPMHLLKNRTVVACFGIAMLLNMSWYLQGDYLYTVLVVAFGESVKSATRIATFYSFTSAIAGLIIGAITRYVRRVKAFIIAGVGVYMIAFGLLIRFRGGTADHGGVIAGQVVLGLAGGMFPYQAQVLIQACVTHQNLAVITSLYLTSYSIGSALGNTVSGAIWTQVLPSKLATQLGNASLAAEVYGDPFTFAAAHPMGDPAREAVVVAYQQTQRLLCITGLCLAVPLLACGALVRDLHLGDGHNVVEAEERAKNDAGAAAAH